MKRMSRLALPLWAIALTACLADPTPLSQATIPVMSPTPLPTLAVLVPANPPLECGAEAAIALAQTQSDLALAADSKVESLQQTNAEVAIIAQTGVQEYSLARDLLKAYAVPDCLLQAKVFADQFFGERIEAYAALSASDTAGYETHLNNSEIARQNMITVVNGVLGQ